MIHLGIDIGTQSLKTVVVDEGLRVVAAASVGYPVHHPRPGWAEQDPRDWERAAAETIARALASAGLTAGDVASVGVAGQLDGCIAVDESGEPVAPCLIWMDRRAGDQMPDLPRDFRDRTGLVADPGHMAAKIAWLSARNPGARYHQPVSYLVERLTGRAVFDPALASTTMLFELGATEPAADLCERFGIDPASLPEVAAADSVAGQVSDAGAKRFGLRPGTAVAVGTGDDFATPLGAGVAAPGPLFCVLGTAEVVGSVTLDRVVDGAGLLETHGYPGGQLVIENPGWLAGGAVGWARGLLGFADERAFDAAAAEAPAADLLFIPALTGAMAPRWHPGARGCFYGLTPAHDRGHMARAVLEGCAMAMHDVVIRLNELGLMPTEIIALGGGAASDLWLQIRADLTGLSVRGSSADTCAMGAALLGIAAAAGRSVVQLAADVDQDWRTFEPDSHGGRAYRLQHQRYRKLFRQLEPVFDS